MFVFGIYVAVLGVTLLVAPNLLLGIFGIPVTQEVWIRLLGGVLIAVAFYYVDGARSRATRFMRVTVVARAFVAGVLFVLVVLGFAPPIIALFGATDLAAAGWTAYALRSPRPSPSA